MNAQVTIHTGYVTVASSFDNQYLVSTESGVITATALESGSGRRGGHIGGGSYMPGAFVVVAQIVREAEDSTNTDFPNLIMGAFNPYPVFEGTEFDYVEQIPDTYADSVRNEAYRRILETNSTTRFLNESRASNRPLDALPGDWFKSTVLGGCFLLSEFLARVGSSADNSLTFHGLDQMAELISMNFSADHASEFRELIHRGITPIDLAQFAFNLEEAMGGNEPFVDAEDEERPWLVDPKEEGQTGLFRRALFQGGVEGSWDSYRTDMSNRDVYTFGNEVYPGVLSEARRMDGIYRLRAISEIKFEKTWGIVSPWKKTELRNAPSPESPPEVDNRSDQQRIEEDFGLTPDEASAIRPLLHNAFDTDQEEAAFYRGLRRDNDVWYFPTSDEVKDVVFDTEDPSLRVLQQQEQSYTLDDVVSKEEEIYPGRKIQIFKNSSVFLMSDDGGIVIGDGFGAEI